MQRILHIVGKMDRAGAETMLMNLYRAIDRTEFQFDFVVFTDKPGDYDEEIKSLGGKIYIINKQNPITRMLALKNLLQRHPEYEILHGHTLLSNSFHVLAAKSANVPYRIVHAHSTSKTSGNYITYLYQKFSKRVIGKDATHYIGCGKAAAKFLFPGQKEVLMLPNSVDTAHFAEMGETNKNFLNNEFNLDESYLKIIQVGRLQVVKNHKFSIKLAKKLKEQDISFKMFFVGQGELHDDIKGQIHFADLQDEVLLLGLREDIPQIMAGADLMIMPSIYEGFPVVLVESQSIGLPSLISDSVSAEVDLNVHLIEFESLNSPLEFWVEKILKIKNNKKLKKKVRLRRMAEQGFDIYCSVKVLTKLYKSLNLDD
jgi:glycosyltransferase EpsF